MVGRWQFETVLRRHVLRLEGLRECSQNEGEDTLFIRSVHIN